jgi:hypothetical protein
MKLSISRKLKLVTAIIFTSMLLVPTIVAIHETIDADIQNQQQIKDLIQTRNIGGPTPIFTYWAKSYILDNQKLIGKAVMENHNGNYIVTGDIKEDAKQNIFLMELDTAGNVQWFIVYDLGASAAYDGAREEVTAIDEVVLASGDYGYVITGYTDMYSTDNPPSDGSLLPPGDVYVMQVDDSGTPLWLKAYLNLINPNNYQGGTAIRSWTIGGDTRLLVIGTSNTPLSINLDIIALLLDINGNVVQYVQLDGNVDEGAYAAAIHTDTTGSTTFGICGFQNPGAYGQRDPLFIKLNANLDILYTREYGIFDQNGVSHDDRLNSIQTTDDEHFIMCGTSYSHPSSNLASVLVIHADIDGKPLWIRTYNEMPPNGRDNRGIAIDEFPALPDHFVLTCIRGADPDYDLGIMGVNKTLNLEWARMLQAGKPNHPCNTNLNGAELTFDLMALTDGFILTGMSDSTEAVPNTNFPGAVVCKFDDEGYIRKTPTPCCTQDYELFEYLHDEHQTIDLERIQVQYEVPDWMPSYYDDSPKSQKICTPGFETIVLLGAVAVMFLFMRKRLK